MSGAMNPFWRRAENEREGATVSAGAAPRVEALPDGGEGAEALKSPPARYGEFESVYARLEEELQAARAAEHAKYVKAYALPGYRLHGDRFNNAKADLEACKRGSLLDVGCGRGEMLDYAETIGFWPCRGTEVIPALVDGVRVVHGEAHALPFEDYSFDVVTCNDVIEHILPGDDELLCKELARVAKRTVLITANNKPSVGHIGEELHVNKRPYEVWDRLFRLWFGPHAVVKWIPTRQNHETERWRVDL